MPPAPGQRSHALQEFHYTQPPSIEALRCRSCTAQCPQAMLQWMTRVPQPSAPGQCGGAKHGLHCPRPTNSEAVHCTSCGAHPPKAVWQ